MDQLPYAFGRRRAIVQELKQLLRTGITAIYDEEKNEEDTIFDIRSLEHSTKIRRVHSLDACLNYAATKYEYIYELLRHLYSVLKSEARLLEKLAVADLRKYRKNANLLQSEFSVEVTILKKVGEIKTFHDLLADLVRGEHIIHKIDTKVKRIIRSMQQGAPIGGITDKCISAVFDAIEDKVRECVANGTISGYHNDVDLEFVNSPGFIKLVN